MYTIQNIQKIYSKYSKNILKLHYVYYSKCKTKMFVLFYILNII
jgi:hypothetical protein